VDKIRLTGSPRISDGQRFFCENSSLSGVRFHG
jgi:hypothetical protein